MSIKRLAAPPTSQWAELGIITRFALALGGAFCF
jgi:hypothetical protein